MLVLNRRTGESVKIQDHITVSVLAVYGQQVKLGFEAPAEVSVYREELYYRIQEQKESAEDSHDPQK